MQQQDRASRNTRLGSLRSNALRTVMLILNVGPRKSMNETDDRYPKSTRDLWAALKNEVTWIHGRWIMYRQLYGTSPERIDILNCTASTFFVILGEVLLRDVQLSLSKLADQPKTSGRRNMTLSALAEHLSSCGETIAAENVKSFITSYETACEQLRQRRHKTIAHNDLPTALAARVSPVKGPSREEIEKALAALRDAMNCIELHYAHAQTRYELFSMVDDGEALLQSLRRGVRYRELVREGVIASGDLRQRFRQKAQQGAAPLPSAPRTGPSEGAR